MLLSVLAATITNRRNVTNGTVLLSARPGGSVRYLAAAMVGLSLSINAQTPAPPTPRFTGPDESFEVASVKANRSGSLQWDFDTPPGRAVGTNVVLRDLIRFAYYIYGGDWDMRIAAPDWIKTERFDIDAKTSGTVPVERAMSMLRHLLAERFALKVHYETRQRPIYALVFARTDRRLGPQLKPNPIDCAAYAAAVQAARAGRGAPPPMDPEHPTCGQRSQPGHAIGSGLNMTQLALQITGAAGRPITDDTGLGLQRFDWELRWTPPVTAPESVPAPGPSVFTALEEQLGLKLVPKDGPVEVLVVDHIERPAEN
jgi:uncharacterized protein (TIGR03435 family)